MGFRHLFIENPIHSIDKKTHKLPGDHLDV